MTLQIVFLFVLWIVAGLLFVRAWKSPVGGGPPRAGTRAQHRPPPYETHGQKQP